MKRILLIVFMLMIVSTSVQALSWAYAFVVWDGKVYEVKLEETVLSKEIGKRIGKVTTQPNDMTGDYYGDASNYFSKGTKYFEIEGISTGKSIAVEMGDSQWVKADYVHEAPFHVMNLLPNMWAAGGMVVLLILFIGVRKFYKKSK